MKTFAGVLFVACATEPTETTEPEAGQSTTQQDVATGVTCSDKTWRVNFWSDASQTTMVGWMTCTCFRPQQLFGTTSNFATLAYEFTCDLR